MEKAQALLQSIRENWQKQLGDKLTGIYVHGSIAFGCFRWETSDIDFLAVVEKPLTLSEKEALIRSLLALDACAPVKGLEMSVVLRSVCMPFADPTPFELHYSNTHRESYQRDLCGTCEQLQGVDPDLAAHITVIRHAGLVLCGPPAAQVFGPVPKACYLRSIAGDIGTAAEEIERDPVYYTLNLCRVLAYLKEGTVLSKKQGGEWGIRALPQHAPLIRAALDAYLTGAQGCDALFLC